MTVTAATALQEAPEAEPKETLPEGMSWRHICWTKGSNPKYSKYRNAISDPPCMGWQHALVLEGPKHSTIFCPYTMTSYVVRNDQQEIAASRDRSDAVRLDWLKQFIYSKWAQFQTYGWQRDYDACAIFLRKLGWSVPQEIMTGGGDDTRKKGGKEVGTKLAKPVKANGKRGKFLKWIMDGDGVRSIREAMAEFSMTRSNVLSYLYMLQKDHGIGYELVGDNATIRLPEGCIWPFDTEAPAELKADPLEDDPLEDDPLEDDPLEDDPLEDDPLEDDPLEDANDDDDDSWLD